MASKKKLTASQKRAKARKDWTLEEYEIAMQALIVVGYVVKIDGVYTKPHQVPRNLFGRGQIFPVQRKNPDA